MHNLTATRQALMEAGIPFTQQEPLAKHTSFQVGGPAAFFCIPENTAQLAQALAIARNHEMPYFMLGNGSNVIFRDEGYPGLIVCPGGDFVAIRQEGNRLFAGVAVPLEQLCMAAQAAGLSGLAFAYGIPGRVGGAVYMNAGAYGGELAGVLESVRFLDENGEEQLLPAGQLGFGYRQSLFQTQPWTITEACFLLETGERGEIGAQMDENLRKRREKQPLDKPSAGSAFKRPPGAFAGALIEQCGLRGYRVGDAAISEKHCGFIVNLGSASCRDILRLADDVSRMVQEKTGFVLEKEIRVVDAPGL